MREARRRVVERRWERKVTCSVNRSQVCAARVSCKQIGALLQPRQVSRGARNPILPVGSDAVRCDACGSRRLFSPRPDIQMCKVWTDGQQIGNRWQRDRGGETKWRLWWWPWSCRWVGGGGSGRGEGRSVYSDVPTLLAAASAFSAGAWPVEDLRAPDCGRQRAVGGGQAGKRREARGGQEARDKRQDTIRGGESGDGGGGGCGNGGDTATMYSSSTPCGRRPEHSST